MKRILPYAVLFFLFCFLFANRFLVFAQTCDPNCTNADECRDKIAKCQEAWDMMEVAKKPHVDALRKMESDIEIFQTRIKNIEADLSRKAQAIAGAEKDLISLLSTTYARVKRSYIYSYLNTPYSMFLSSKDIGKLMRTLTYQKTVIDEDKKVITQTALSIKGLEIQKINLEQEKIALASIKKETDMRAESVRKLVHEASSYQSKLSSIIATLTATQQSFLAQKLAGLNLPTSLGAGPLYCTDDRKIDPGFKPAFAFFTFGIPHRIGMNQYGALGRAQSGQGYRDILSAYFDGIGFEKRDPNMRIRVQGYGEKGLDEYLLGVYEMPSDWPMEALKAQVVAARSYAIAYTHNGEKEICTTQSCQVYKGGNKGGSWEQAVRETEGEVMVNAGTVITAWYSSTDGGYTYKSSDVGWADKPWTKRLRDANGDVSSFESLFEKAYDRQSPCFYAAQGWRSEYGKSAWLKESEVADIVNVILLARKDASTRNHLYQPDKPNPEGTESWDASRVREELKSRSGSPYTSISNITVGSVDWGLGKTTGLSIEGDGGSVTIDGGEFKDFFNLRAPGNIQIVGPLFNIERK